MNRAQRRGIEAAFKRLVAAGKVKTTRAQRVKARKRAEVLNQGGLNMVKLWDRAVGINHMAIVDQEVDDDHDAARGVIRFDPIPNEYWEVARAAD